EGNVYVRAGSMTIRRDRFLEAGGFDPRLHCGEDHDLALRLGESPGCLIVEAPCQVAYRRHEVSLTQNMERMFDGVRAILDRERAGAYPGGAAGSWVRRNV